jgi:asparagine N-glycosylation enzyme membrane subunit Stt3
VSQDACPPRAEAEGEVKAQDTYSTGRSVREVGPIWPFVLIAVLAIAAVHVGVFFRHDLANDRLLQDTDAYMWMNRVTHLAETGDWFNHVYPRVNPPDGHAQHWTRPFDVVLLSGGALAGSVLGFERGLYYWALVLTPMLHVLALLTLVWGLDPLVRRKLLPRAGIPTVMLVFVAQVGAYQPFIVGRPDHHAPLALLFVAYLAFLLRLFFDGRHDLRSAVGLGVVAALAVWVNVEALIYVVIGMIGLGLSWLFGDRRTARLNAVHGAVLFLGLLAAWLIEWGPAAPQVRAMDTLSFPHVGLFGYAAVFWGFLWWISLRNLARDFPVKVTLGAGSALAVLGATYLTFPEFFGDPLRGMDSLYRQTRLEYINELQPLLATAESVRAATGRLILFGGIGIACLPYLMGRVLRKGDRDGRIMAVVFALLIAFYLYMTLQQRRWADYLALSAVIPFGLLATHITQHLGKRLSGPSLIAVRPPVLVGLVLGPLILASVLGTGLHNRFAVGPEGPPQWPVRDDRGTVHIPVAARDPAMRTCDLARIAETLEDPRWFPRPESVLAHADHGPELLYRTRHNVLSIPNHRPQPGYTFTWETLADNDHDRAAAALSERGVGIVVLCVSDLMAGFALLRDVEGSFLQYLSDGGVPVGYVLHASTPYWRIYRRDR